MMKQRYRIIFQSEVRTTKELLHGRVSVLQLFATIGVKYFGSDASRSRKIEVLLINHLQLSEDRL